jgi:hypothetical protein
VGSFLRKEASLGGLRCIGQAETFAIILCPSMFHAALGHFLSARISGVSPLGS